MTMSRDRVGFKLDFANMNTATRRAFRIAFGYTSAISPKKATGGWTVKNPVDVREIICRPSQFARFLIYREKFGGANEFKVLEARLYLPEAPRPPPMDVSMNPAHGSCDEEEEGEL